MSALARQHAEALQLHVLDPAGSDSAQQLVEALRSLTGASVFVQSATVSASDPAGALGDLCVPWLTEPGALVVEPEPGHPLAQPLLRVAAALQAPLVTANPAGHLLQQQPGVTDLDGLVLDALSRLVAWSPERDSADRLRLDGLDVLLRVADDNRTVRPTDTLCHLVRSSEGLGIRAPLASACANLLDRMPGGAVYADRLRRHVAHWVRNRLWSSSFVEEMVLHDESHAVSVDRNVAMICAGLTDRLRPRDVYVLALSAWLHDWGHASATLAEGEVPTDPMEVRNYHGPLTAERIRVSTHQHDLESDDIEPGLAAEVALLCGHHQGWTSCDHQDPIFPPDLWWSPRLKQAERAQPLGMDRMGITSFEAEFASAGLPPDRTYDRLCELLAILRIADAADVGQRRVPHYGTREDLHDTLLPVYLQRSSDTQWVTPPALKALHAVDKAYEKLRERTRGLIDSDSGQTPKKTFDEASREIAARFLAPMIISPSKPDDAAPDPRLIAADAWKYAEHVCRQQLFFAEHRAVQLAFARVRDLGNGRGQLCFHLLLDPGQSPDGDPAHREAVEKSAVEAYEQYILSELGRSPIQTGADFNYRNNQAIQAYLLRLCIDHQIDVSVVSDFDEADTPPTYGPLPANLDWTQFSKDRACWRAWRHSGQPGLQPCLPGPTAPHGPGKAAASLMVAADASLAARVVDGQITLWKVNRSAAQPEFGTPFTTSLPARLQQATLLAVGPWCKDRAEAVLAIDSEAVIVEVTPKYDRARTTERTWDCEYGAALLLDQTVLTVDATGQPDEQLRSVIGDLDRITVVDAATNADGSRTLVVAGGFQEGRVCVRAVVLDRGLNPLDTKSWVIETDGAVGVGAVRLLGRGPLGVVVQIDGQVETRTVG